MLMNALRRACLLLVLTSPAFAAPLPQMVSYQITACGSDNVSGTCVVGALKANAAGFCNTQVANPDAGQDGSDVISGPTQSTTFSATGASCDVRFTTTTGILPLVPMKPGHGNGKDVNSNGKDVNTFTTSTNVNHVLNLVKYNMISLCPDGYSMVTGSGGLLVAAQATTFVSQPYSAGYACVYGTPGQPVAAPLPIFVPSKGGIYP